MKTTNEIIIIDLEATCWENDRIPIGQQVDIIEIGICKLKIRLKRTLSYLNMSFEGTHHSGADDAYNTARILSKIL